MLAIKCVLASNTIRHKTEEHAANSRGQERQRPQRSSNSFAHRQIAHEQGQHQRIEHGVKGVERPAHGGGQQRSALAGSGLPDQFEWADGHAQRNGNLADCSRVRKRARQAATLELRSTGQPWRLPLRGTDPVISCLSLCSKDENIVWPSSHPCAICSRSASTEGNLISSRNRSRKQISTSVSGVSSMGWKFSRWVSMANNSAPNVGRFPTLVTESKRSVATRVHVM